MKKKFGFLLQGCAFYLALTLGPVQGDLSGQPLFATAHTGSGASFSWAVTA
jgi:hypothetical protein